MKGKQLMLVSVLMAMLIRTPLYAAGGAVNENLAPLKDLTKNMIAMCKQQNAAGFMQEVSKGLSLTAENLNNSKVLPRVSAKYRAAKRAIKDSQFVDAITALQEAEQIMDVHRPLTWDGGS